LADTLAALYEREAQATLVLEVPARLPREAPAAVSTRAPGQKRTTGTSNARTLLTNGTTALAPARANDEADGTVAHFKPRPGGLSGTFNQLRRGHELRRMPVGWTDANGV
jgi:hypothetical protein